MSAPEERAIPREVIGAYERWVYGPGGAAMPGLSRRRYDHVSALVELPDGLAADGRIDRVELADGSRAQAWMPTLWSPPDGRRLGFVPIAFEAPPELSADARFTACRPGGRAPRRPSFRIDLPILARAFDRNFDPAAAPAAVPVAGLDPGRLVVVAVIDDAIPFAHRTLRDRAGRSRVDYCWLQSAPRDPATPGRVLYGREFAGADIDRLAARFGRDEDVLYREAGAAEIDLRLGTPIERLATHGAVVVDRAAGRGGLGALGADLDHVRVIAVQVADRVTLDTAGFRKEGHVLAALHYVFERADRIARAHGAGPLPLVINFSFGYTGGPHDGGDTIERALDELVAARRCAAPTALVLPAGNSFVAGLNGVVRPDHFVDGRFRIPWRVQPDDRTANYLEVWFPDLASVGRFGAVMRDPVGRTVLAADSLALPPGADPDAAVITPIEDPTGGVIGQFAVEAFQGRRARLVVILGPSEPEGGVAAAASAGLWTIELVQGAGTCLDPGLRIDCRIQRDIDPGNYRVGSRQSYFDDWRDRPFDDAGRIAQADRPEAFLRRFGSLSGLATGARATVVAGTVALTGAPARYSSAGEKGGATGVRCAAPSDRAHTVLGISGAGTRSGAHAVVVGTSAAAPQVTAALARAFLTRRDPETTDNYLELLPGTPTGADPVEIARLGRLRVAADG